MRFGLIGYGTIGAVRAESLAQTPGAELRIIAEVIPGARARACERWKNVRVIEDFRDLVAAPDIDAVIVSTPPNVHRLHCETALAAGKHVLCEKPLASTVEDCRAIVATAERRGRTLATGFNYRFYPAVVKARELIESGRIGEIVHVASFAGHPGGPEFTHHWVHDPDIMGGGALMDNGIHAADLTLHFLGHVEEAHGFSSDRVWNFGRSEDNGFVLMRTASGRIGTLHASWTEWPGYHFHVDIQGTQGGIRLWYPPMATLLYDRPRGSAKRGRRSVFLFPKMQILERLRSYRWTIIQSFIAEHQDFMRRVSDDKGVGATGVDGLRAVELAYSAYRPSPRNLKVDISAVAGAVT
jgi:predicted dehydrogenase